MELQTKQLVLAIKQIAEEKNLPQEIVEDVIQQAIAAAYRKDFGEREQEVRSVINFTTGDVTVFVSKEVVDNVEDEIVEISVKDAQQIEKSAKVGDIVEVKDRPTTFGRVAAQTAKQVILQKLRESEREIILDEYQDQIGSVLNGVVQRVESRVVRVELGKAAGILPMSEQIYGEHFSTGNRIKVFLKEVERTNRGPQLILSRAVPEFVEHLFRNEVPEMESGAVEIKKIAREAGVRTKLAVASTVPGVDPVGTFVGGHGTRVQAVMSEIGDSEKIDVITFSDDPKEFIESALSPTDVSEVIIDEANKKAIVRVNEDQLSVAIGKSGQNVRLASKLSGYEIDIESTMPKTEEPAPAPAENIEAPAATEAAKEVKPQPKSDAQPKPSASKQNNGNNKPRLKRKSELEDSLLSAIEQHGDEGKTSDEA